MKIQGGLLVHKLSSLQSLGNEGQQPHKSVQGAERIELSGAARFIQNLRSDASELPDLRMDAVEQAKADVANGTLGTEEDLEAAVDALLLGF